MHTNPTAPAAPPGLLDVLAPQALEFGARRITFGDQSARVLLVTDYPPRVGPAWLGRIARLPGVVLSAHLVPAEPAALVQAINRSVGELAGRLQAGGGALVMQRTEQALKDAETLLRKIDQEQQERLLPGRGPHGPGAGPGDAGPPLPPGGGGVGRRRDAGPGGHLPAGGGASGRRAVGRPAG